MASLRELKRRIRSTQSTQQIMRAMQLVSGSKFKRTQGKLLEARSVLEFLDGLRNRVLAASPDLAHPLSERRETGQSALVIVTSDAGLCGSYNTNLIQLAEAHLRRDGLQRTQVIYIGKKGHRYFTKRGYAAADAYLDLAGRPNLQKTEAIGRALMDRFLTGQVSSVQLLYSRFISSMVYRPTILQWLPVELSGQVLGSTAVALPPASLAQDDPSTRSGRHPERGLRPSRGVEFSAPREASGVPQEYIFEPSPQRVFEDLLPRWALATFQLVLLEAFTSEHSARMIAMKNATDNAEKIVEELTLQRNKIRQASITKEISEIVGTAEALK